jgi:hypothetical protein
VGEVVGRLKKKEFKTSWGYIARPSQKKKKKEKKHYLH